MREEDEELLLLLQPCSSGLSGHRHSPNLSAVEGKP
jgi:hypothetical protein